MMETEHKHAEVRSKGSNARRMRLAACRNRQCDDGSVSLNNAKQLGRSRSQRLGEAPHAVTIHVTRHTATSTTMIDILHHHNDFSISDTAGTHNVILVDVSTYLEDG